MIFVLSTSLMGSFFQKSHKFYFVWYFINLMSSIIFEYIMYYLITFHENQITIMPYSPKESYQQRVKKSNCK